MKRWIAILLTVLMLSDGLGVTVFAEPLQPENGEEGMLLTESSGEDVTADTEANDPAGSGEEDTGLTEQNPEESPEDITEVPEGSLENPVEGTGEALENPAEGIEESVEEPAEGATEEVPEAEESLERELQEADYQPVEPVSEVYVNPLYADEVSPSDLDEPSEIMALADDVEYYTSVKAAGDAMRAQMKNRVGTIKLGYKTTGDYSQILYDIPDRAMMHTGNPTEGDYIKWQYAGWNGAYSGYESGNTTYLTVEYTVTYYTTAAQEKKMDTAVANCLNSLQLDGKSTYETVYDIYDYICNNITYDYDNLNDSTYKLKYTAYAALINKTAVCQGYALLFYRLALEEGIDARLISGIGNGGAHGWNIVNIDGKYYNLDSTWDAPRAQHQMPYEYFLLNSDNFSDHTRDAEYLTEEFMEKYPMAEKDYEPGKSGTCGESLHWNLTDAGELFITGSGAMDDYEESPWKDKNVQKAYIADGVTGIGERAFYECESLQYAEIPDSVVSIGTDAFTGTAGTLKFKCYADTCADTYARANGIRTEYIEVVRNIEYVLNGGTNHPENPAQIGRESFTLKNPSRKGYAFSGWYTTSQLTNKITQIPSGIRPDYILYAKWTKISVDKGVISSIKNNGTTSLQVTFNSVSGADGYEIQCSADKSFKEILHTQTAASAGTVTLTELTPGTKYYVRVRAYKTDSAGEKVYGAYSTNKEYNTACEAPQIRKLTGGSKAVKITWNAVDGAEKYQLYMAEKETGTYTKIATLSKGTTSYTKKELGVAKSYYFKVRAYSTVGSENIYSGYSEIKCGATRTATPKIGTATGGEKEITVKWNKVSGADGYTIYRGTKANGTYSEIATVGSGSVSYTATGLTEAKDYYFKVSAYKKTKDMTVNSSQSSYVWAGTAAKTPAISKITGGAKKITVQWGKVSGASGYQVYMATSKTGTYSKIASVSSGTTSYAKTGLSEAKNYYFKVRSYRKVNGSVVYSSFCTAEYGTTSPAKPVISSVKGGTKKVTVSWKKVKGAAGYDIYMATSAKGSYSKIKSVGSDTTSYAKTGLSNGKNYYFKVKAYRLGEDKAKVSSSASAYGYSGTATAAPAISSIGKGTDKLTVKWNNVSGETKYVLYMATSQNGTYSKIATLNANVCSYTKTGLKANTTYYFKIRTYRTVNKSNVYSSYSEIQSAATKPVEYVYVTPSGSCYHRQECATTKNSKSLTKLKKSSAQAKGYKACKVCKP